MIPRLRKEAQCVAVSSCYSLSYLLVLLAAVSFLFIPKGNNLGIRPSHRPPGRPRVRQMVGSPAKI